MRKMMAMTLVSCLLLASLPGAAMAGDTHAVSNRWAGVAIGAAAAVVGGAILSAIQAPAIAPPVVYGPPPVAYAPAPQIVYTTSPPVVYAPPQVVYAAPPVIYHPAPVVVHREWGHPVHWNRAHVEHARGWDHR